LWFDTHAQNLGTVPLQLSFAGLQDDETATAAQCISWRADRVCREQQEVGGFSWHAEHNHFHFNEFAGYQLRRLLRNGSVDYSPRGLIAASDKVSFCLIDSERIRDDASPTQFYVTCTPTVEGISPGWSDIYTSDLEGQQLPIDGLVDGRYALVISVDYGNRLFETNDDDNVVEAVLDISGGATQVTIVDRKYP
jgi:hypothetical protein